MTKLEQLKADPIWDARYNLPTCPTLNNPWIYMAYADLVCDGALPRSTLGLFYILCSRVDTTKKIEGLISRWPDGSGGNTSHDELIGLAHLAPWTVELLLNYLDSHLGEYNATGEKENVPLQFNIYRFAFMRPYLVAASGDTPSILGQLSWCTMLLLDAHNSDLGGGKLRNWVMMQHMQRFWLCRMAIRYWKGVMKMRGITPKTALKIEPKEYEILSQLAPTKWT